MFKKILSFIIIMSFHCLLCKAESLQGYINNTQQYIKINKNNIITANLTDGLNSNFIKNDDEIFARVSKDVFFEDKIAIPRNTMLHGRIKELKNSDNNQKNASFLIKYDYLLDTNDKKIPIDATTTTKLNSIHEIANKVIENSANILAGGALGALGATSLLGIDTAIISSGASIATGAAIGGIVGLGYGLTQKGKDIEISNQDEISVKFNSDFYILPQNRETLYNNRFNNNNIDLTINNIKYKKNKYHKVDIICINFTIINQTDYEFHLFDIVLRSEKGIKYYPNIFVNNELNNLNIPINKKMQIEIPFAVDNVKEKTWLVFNFNQNEIAKFSLDKAYDLIPEEQKIKNDSMFANKKNFYIAKDVPFGG